jgi:hypothetical protein
MRLALPAALLLAALAPAAPAAASQSARDDAWATINVCDTAKHPDTIGIRASIPGTPRGTRLALRFRVQYRSATGWQDADQADSGWQSVGVAKGVPVESGWSFTYPHTSTVVTLHGVVDFRWRRPDGTVARRLELTTEAGHRSSAGADPPGYSAATCALGG